MRAISYLAELF